MQVGYQAFESGIQFWKLISHVLVPKFDFCCVFGKPLHGNLYNHPWWTLSPYHINWYSPNTFYKIFCHFSSVTHGNYFVQLWQKLCDCFWQKLRDRSNCSYCCFTSTFRFSRLSCSADCFSCISRVETLVTYFSIFWLTKLLFQNLHHKAHGRPEISDVNICKSRQISEFAGSAHPEIGTLQIAKLCNYLQ